MCSVPATPNRSVNSPTLVGVIMGSGSDWETMALATTTLEQLAITFETKIVSAHRTPNLLYEYAQSAETRGLQIIIAGAGGSAHLPGMIAAITTLPVLGVPIQSKQLQGIDSLLSIVQMPAGVPVATFAIGKCGAVNSALFAAAILALRYPEIKAQLEAFRSKQTEAILNSELPKLTHKELK